MDVDAGARSSGAAAGLDHDAADWLVRFRAAGRDGSRPLRVEIAKQTEEACRALGYTAAAPAGPGGWVGLPEGFVQAMVGGTVNYRGNDPVFRRGWPKVVGAAAAAAAVEVKATDCLDAVLALKDEGYNPVLLNMANAYRAGGGWRTGAGAQEENIFRRSNCCHFLEQQKGWPAAVGRSAPLEGPAPSPCTLALHSGSCNQSKRSNDRRHSQRTFQTNMLGALAKIAGGSIPDRGVWWDLHPGGDQHTIVCTP